MQPLINPFSQDEQAQLAQRQLPASRRMFFMFYNMMAFQAIRVAVIYNLAGLIEANGALTVAELAERTETHAFSLYRLLRALASIGIFQPVNPEEENVLQIRFAQTDLSQTLVPDLPGSLYVLARWLGLDWHLESWNVLARSIATGEPGVHIRIGQDFWQFLQEHPTDQILEQDLMTWMTQQAGNAFLQSYDFSQIQRIVDVAGGRGSFLAHILHAYPHLVGTLFDTAEIIEQARPLLQDGDLAHRCELVTGNFFEAAALPAGGDCYCLRQILHDWNDDHCLQILRNIHHAIHPQGRLLIFERLIEPGPNASFNTFFDLGMLVLLEGRERTPHEYEQLLQRAGFRLAAIRPTPSTFSIIEATPL